MVLVQPVIHIVMFAKCILTEISTAVCKWKEKNFGLAVWEKFGLKILTFLVGRN